MLFQCTVGVFLEFKRVLLFIARSNSSRSLYRSVSGWMLNHSDIRYRLFTNILEQSFSIDLMAWGGNWYVRILSRSQSTCGLRRSFTCNSILLFYAPDGVSHCTSFSVLYMVLLQIVGCIINLDFINDLLLDPSIMYSTDLRHSAFSVQAWTQSWCSTERGVHYTILKHCLSSNHHLFAEVRSNCFI